MKHKIDLENWARIDHFRFFRQFEEPFFGVTVEIDCTKAYHACKARDCSFFLYYLHKSLLAANYVEPFRYRIIDEEVYVYDQVNASPTINRPDGTFGFAYMNFEQDFHIFLINARIEMERVRHAKGLAPAIAGENVIHYSSLPWINFTAVSHARSFSFKDSIPKITFGKMKETDGKKLMPVSIHVHHALMDGWHVGQFLDHYQMVMDQG
ncbi:MAG: chloramphenicol acetyltransferase [Saprospiraceae bacterium]|nr:chloramphenicol acetyltransferase [Saprospiraceae bacterium]